MLNTRWPATTYLVPIGLITGVILRLPVLGSVTDEEQAFHDNPYWEMPEKANIDSKVNPVGQQIHPGLR